MDQLTDRTNRGAIMRKHMLSWIVAAGVTAGLLLGAHRIVQANEIAMSGPVPGQSSTFFGH
jgi:hypothetical protein